VIKANTKIKREVCPASDANKTLTLTKPVHLHAQAALLVKALSFLRLTRVPTTVLTIVSARQELKALPEVVHARIAFPESSTQIRMVVAKCVPTTFIKPVPRPLHALPAMAFVLLLVQVLATMTISSIALARKARFNLGHSLVSVLVMFALATSLTPTTMKRRARLARQDRSS